MTETRKLAAVMFTDIIGYTALMSKDEQKALKTLQKNRDLQKSLAEKHNGEFLKEMGDGTLLCFQSALDADPQDGPAKVYVERCAWFKANPPPDDWDGSFTLTEK